MNKLKLNFGLSLRKLIVNDNNNQFRNSIPGRSDRNISIFSWDKLLRNHFNDEGALRMNLMSAFCGTTTVLSQGLKALDQAMV